MQKIIIFLKNCLKEEEWTIEPCGLRTVLPDVLAIDMGEAYSTYISQVQKELHQKLHL